MQLGKSFATPITILVVDDDTDDQLLIEDAFSECRLMNPLHFVDNGEQLFEYLDTNPPPGVILLDLNMPKMDGHTALGLLKRDERYNKIPVIVLTTSKNEEDVVRSYDLGVNSFITKPVTFDGLLDVVQALGRYWLEVVSLPEDDATAAA